LRFSASTRPVLFVDSNCHSTQASGLAAFQNNLKIPLLYRVSEIFTGNLLLPDRILPLRIIIEYIPWLKYLLSLK